MQENYPCLVAAKPLKPEYQKFNIIQITSEEFTIGRGLDNNAIISYLPMSRKHCAFKMSNENEWFIEDFSAYGIEVNNKLLKKGVSFKLGINDIIKLDTTGGEFVYKFIMRKDDDFVPRKRIKLEDPSDDILNSVKMKFEESQNFEIKHIEDKINNTKQMLNTSNILKQQLELDMTRKMEQLQSDFDVQIENLVGEKNEVERQKALLEKERDAQLSTVQQEMESKITELMDRIQKHNETETELLNENTSLKEKLEKERQEFLAELHRENSSKQDLLAQLEGRIKEQEEARLREKQELEIILKKETEQLMMAKEEELKKLEEQKKLRERELETELTRMKSHLTAQTILTESEKRRLEGELRLKMEEMARASELEKSKVELLLQERAEAERKLSEAQTKSKQSIEKLEQHVREREVELAALAAQRIQQQADQSSEVITSLQQQLENVRSQLKSVETEKSSLIEHLSTNPEGSTKEATLAEVGDLMESELQCSICAELFVAATTLNCSHTFCKYCITVWQKKKRECPICRAKIVSECKSLVLDSFIERMVANLTDEMKTKRQGMLKEREELNAVLARQTDGGSRRRGSSYGGSENSFGEYDSELGEEEHEDYYGRTSSRGVSTSGGGDYGSEFGEEDYYDDDHSYNGVWGDHIDDSDGGSDDDGRSGGSGAAGAADGRGSPAGDSGGSGGDVSSGSGGYEYGDAPRGVGGASAGSDATGRTRSELGSGAGSGEAGAPPAPAGHGPRRRPRRGRVAGDPEAYYGGYGRCFRCGARGHWAPGCPSRYEGRDDERSYYGSHRRRRRSSGHTDDSATSNRGSATSNHGSASSNHGSATSNRGSATSNRGSDTSNRGSATSNRGSATSNHDSATSNDNDGRASASNGGSGGADDSGGGASDGGGEGGGGSGYDGGGYTSGGGSARTGGASAGSDATGSTGSGQGSGASSSEASAAPVPVPAPSRRRRPRRRGNVAGDPGAYYGGYGRCFRCGARGHWAPGCPSR